MKTTVLEFILYSVLIIMRVCLCNRHLCIFKLFTLKTKQNEHSKRSYSSTDI